MLFPRCSLKRLLYLLFFLFTGTAVLLNMSYMSRIADVKMLIDQFHGTIFFQRLYTNRILLWNPCEKLKGLDIQCPDYNCVFQIRTGGFHVEDIYLYHILFDEDVLNSTDRPVTRWEHQLYIFWSLVPAKEAPACGVHNDNFFNWTFTYRLDSTLVWTFFVVQNLTSDEIVAPDKSVEWKQSYDPLNSVVQVVLDEKHKALAWIKTDCSSKTHPGDNYMKALQTHIVALGLQFDVIDECSSADDRDSNVVEVGEYYFLLAFEDYFVEDYVTDKVMRAFNNYVVPIVYGGANYSWFLPTDSYLDASKIPPLQMAHAIRRAIHNTSIYEHYLSWTNLYYISAYADGEHPLCHLCTALNDRSQSIRHDDGHDFQRWWNTPEAEEKCNETAK